MARIFIAGVTGALGLRIARLLVTAGHDVSGSWRTEEAVTLSALSDLGVTLHRLDLQDTDKAAALIVAAEAAILTPILTVSGPAARAALATGTATRLILISSNNVAIDFDAPVYEALRAEEARVADVAGNWTILRPTMIFGHDGDGNIARLRALARKLPFLPLPGTGQAMQQPVHIDDLADLAVHLLDCPDTAQQIYSAAGPVPLRLDEMYRAVMVAEGKTPHLLKLPAGLLLPLAKAGEALGLSLPLSTKQLARAEADKLPQSPMPPGWKPKRPFPG